MPTTFNVISLGVQTLIDPTEGSDTIENASALVGLTVGALGDPLLDNFVSLSSAGAGFTGGNNTAYDNNNNNSDDQFSIDGGPAQTFDAVAPYNATITFTDGTTANVTAVVFQDTAGNTYLAPEFSSNADQALYESGALRSITLDSLIGGTYSGLTGTRQAWNFVTCFAQGTGILTPDGEVSVEQLSPGDKVCTLNSGDQTIRWVGIRSVPAIDKLAPIRIKAGALGQGLPKQDLCVSRQHRMLCRSKVAKRMFDTPEALISANKLTVLSGVRQDDSFGWITYCHILCDTHEVVYANGMPAETLYLGTQTKHSMTPEALEEIRAIFPELVEGAKPPTPAHFMPGNAPQRNLMRRLRKNRHPFYETS
ncbi:Hint domain-containing protein [Aliiroseovarius halocynthiae]|uniref:Hint domain-containing protein n=1 Tax=Aliiroseovarius halocynthiae TaxID=985055 RepID=A0A545SRM9_9RHOB|nr:Hint domain-containing protein [Aliiroseovarius halocynthiae]TQV67607.1 Hint domain-containing protein [Aliiroseovarius halocynthiae]SMR81628.1 Hint domain-containing protein [Aliiroseovarius halocynthiae]